LVGAPRLLRCRALAALLVEAELAAVKRRDRASGDVKLRSESPLRGLGNLDFARPRQEKLAPKRTLTSDRESLVAGTERGSAGLLGWGEGDADIELRGGRRVPCGSGEGEVKAVSVAALEEMDRRCAARCSQTVPSPISYHRGLALGCGNAGSSAAVGRP
jgi:hypothetical protein